MISTAGFHHPACHGLAYAGPLLEACKRGGSTLAGVGLNPGFIAERVATLLTGLCAQLESQWRATKWPTRPAMPSPEFVFGLMGFGADPRERDVTTEPIAAMYGELFMEVLHAVADALRLARRVADVRSTPSRSRRARSASRPARSPQGTVAATQWRWRARLESGVEVLHSVTWTADPALHGASSPGGGGLAHRDRRASRM